MMSLISPAAMALQRHALAAHETLGGGSDNHVAWQLRDVVRESWMRSLEYKEIAASNAHTVLSDDALHELRSASPLRLVLPVFDRLLLDTTRDAGLLLAIGDPTGRLLWVKGERQILRAAEAMAFVPGSDWSERAVGTSAPGTALVTGRGVQVSGAEHFDSIAHHWSCSAVPIHSPDSGELLGVVDLTGGEAAVGGYSLALLKAAVAAAESELRWHEDHLEVPRKTFVGVSGGKRIPTPSSTPILAVTTGAGAELRCGEATLELGTRHAELLVLLSWYPRGLTGEELVELLHINPDAADLGTLRAEFVRLRKAMADFDPRIVPLSRPYRLPQPLLCDAREVLRAIEGGRLDDALDHYAGPVLVRSMAPGIESIREQVFAALRQAMLQDGNDTQLLRFMELPEVQGDEEVLTTTLQVLPAKSPHRALVVAALESIGPAV